MKQSSHVHSACSKCPPSAAMQAQSFLRHSLIADHVYRNQIKDMEELLQRVVGSVDQRVINSAIREWHKTLWACIAADGGHFVYALWTWLLCFVL